MNIVQTLRRLGQKCNGWSEATNMQDAQLQLAKKLYSKNGLTIEGGGACPEQYDVFKNGKQIAYYRLRHGEFRVHYPDHTGKPIYEAEPSGDGIFNNNERLVYLSRAMREVLNKLKTQ